MAEILDFWGLVLASTGGRVAPPERPETTVRLICCYCQARRSIVTVDAAAALRALDVSGGLAMTMTDWVIIAMVAVFGLGTLFNRIRALERTVAKQEEYLDRLTDYAKEIDPRFDEERRLLADVDSGVMLAGMHHMDLVKEKRARGERTLLDPI